MKRPILSDQARRDWADYYSHGIDFEVPDAVWLGLPSTCWGLIILLAGMGLGTYLIRLAISWLLS